MLTTTTTVRTILGSVFPLRALSSSQSTVLINKRKMTNTTLIKEDTPIIPLEEVKRFIVDCMEAVSTPTAQAIQLADLLVDADYRGHYSHGMNRLGIYMEDVESGVCNGGATPEILKETVATAWVDGKSGLGAVVGNFCMDLAIKKAKEVGIGWVTCKGSNHYGIAGFYSMQAQKQNLIGFSATNTSPFMAPTRAKKPALGTNPLSLATPASTEPGMVLDMATTAVAVGKIEIQRRKDEPIPDGWAMNKDGQETNDPFEAQYLYPLGGQELNSGYKGYGLGILVEALCGILAGAQYGPYIRKWGDITKVANLGQTFFALNPECFAPDFKERMQDLTNTLRDLEPADPNHPVLVPGDPEAMHMVAVDTAGGVRYLKNQMENCERIAEKYNVKPLRPKII